MKGREKFAITLQIKNTIISALSPSSYSCPTTSPPSTSLFSYPGKIPLDLDPAASPPPPGGGSIPRRPLRWPPDRTDEPRGLGPRAARAVPLRPADRSDPNRLLPPHPPHLPILFPSCSTSFFPLLLTIKPMSQSLLQKGKLKGRFINPATPFLQEYIITAEEEHGTPIPEGGGGRMGKDSLLSPAAPPPAPLLRSADPRVPAARPGRPPPRAAAHRPLRWPVPREPRPGARGAASQGGGGGEAGALGSVSILLFFARFCSAIRSNTIIRSLSHHVPPSLQPFISPFVSPGPCRRRNPRVRGGPVPLTAPPPVVPRPPPCPPPPLPSASTSHSLPVTG